MQETAVSLIPEEEVAFLREKEDKKFFDFITDELSKAISEKLIQVLETNDEIIIKKPVLRISEYGPLNSVEYRKIVDWVPLIRCKDCKHYYDEEKWCSRLALCREFDENGFCSHGERREDE
jgi:hypothetical protein